MSKFAVIEAYTTTGEHIWIVDAPDAESAKELVRSGDVEMHRDKEWNVEGDELTTEEITDETN